MCSSNYNTACRNACYKCVYFQKYALFSLALMRLLFELNIILQPKVVHSNLSSAVDMGGAELAIMTTHSSTSL